MRNLTESPVPRPDLSEVDWDSLSSWGTRLLLASLGWQTQVNIEVNPHGRLHVWMGVTHNAWHGTLGEVKFTSRHNVDNLDEAVDLIPRLLRERAILARRAWDEFPHAVPFAMPDGTLVIHDRETEHARTFPRGVVRPERARPTEALPGWPGHPTPDKFLQGDGEAWLRGAARCVRTGGNSSENSGESNQAVSYADSLDDFQQTLDPWNHKNRIWSFRVDAIVWIWNGTRVSNKTQRYTSGLSTNGFTPTPLSAAMLVEFPAALLADMELRYPPGSILPPGLTEYVIPPPVVYGDDGEPITETAAPSP